ncbi:MAG: hypothetical protein GY913_00350 [Proteobacteria bacterium]|nr:hypothetical protein [Pseudomonadota bacterium]MCP4915347.1 hypothetical protein [Pseudomonadota bacterium]
MSLTFVALSLGCLSPIGHPAPNDYTLTQITEGLSVSWSSAANGYGDGIGVLAPIDVGVFDQDGYAAPGIQVEFLSNYGGVYLIPEAAIQEVDPPDPQEAGANCTPGHADYDPEVCPWYDESSERYFQLSASYSGEYAPNYVLAASDEFGRVRVWAFVDALPESDDKFDATSVTILMGSSSGAFTIEPLSE